MKFHISTKTLKEWLDIVNHATASISTTPILENILIKANFKNIVLTSNNLEMAIEHVISENIKIDSEGSFCVPSKIFTNYISLLDDDNIYIELLKDESIEIKTESWNVKIKGNNAEDFPLIPTVKENNSFELSGKVIRKSIEKTIFSSAEWNIRPTLAWIFIALDKNKAKFATTDSFRMTEYKVSLEKEFNSNFSQILPNKAAFELRSILDDSQDVKITVWDSQIVFQFENTKFYSRLLNWKFPDYEWFFPTTYSTKSVLNRIDLMQSLKKINLLSKENNYSIKVSFSNETWILLETSETQIWEWKISLVWTVEWDDNIIWLNSEYFLECLSVIDTTHVSISFESPLSPILITPVNDEINKKDNSSFKSIIMPLKI